MLSPKTIGLLFFRLNRCETDEFDAVGGFFQDFEAVRFYQHSLALGGDGAGGEKDVAGYGLIAVVLRDVEAEALVELAYFAAA